MHAYKKHIINNKSILLVALLLSAFYCNSQITISKPNIGFTQACASASFNNYSFNFSFFPVANLGAGNQFIVELSDATGSFTSPTIVNTLTNTTSPVSSSFSLPTTAYGENYKIRVRSTNPVAVSPASNVFAAYYAIHNQPYSINNNVGSVFLCSNETYTLSIDNTGTPASPTYYPFLTYKWYKNYNLIPGETSSSINVFEAGSYYCIVDYGTCVMNSYSNIVSFSIQPELTPTISASNTTLCPNQTVTLTSVLQDASYLYKWYKDNIEQTGPNSATFNVTTPGIYHLELIKNGCIFESNPIEIDSYDYTVSVDSSDNITLIPGQSVTVNATTTAITPQYQWSLNGTSISGATSPSLTISNPGTYTISVSENSPCVITRTKTIEVNYPTDFTPTIVSTTNNTCQNNSVTLSLNSITTIINSTTTNISLSPTFTYQWYKNGTAVAGANSSSITIANDTENGNYHLVVGIPGIGNRNSNSITVNLFSITTAPVITANGILCNSSSIVTITNNIVASHYTYKWFKDNIEIPGANNPSLTTSDEGLYYLQINLGSCSIQSNSILLNIGTIDILSSSDLIEVLLPGGNVNLFINTNATNPSYTWYFNGVVMPGLTTNSINVNQTGTYKVIVTQTDSCNTQIELEFQVTYPNNFNVQITNETGYTNCQSNSVTLSVSEISTTIDFNTVQLPADPTFIYQWYKNGSLVSGATQSNLTINNDDQNGDYYIEVTISGIGTQVSNTISIQLFSISTVTVSSPDLFCDSSSSVTLESSATNPNYNYTWYKDGTLITGATSYNYTTNQTGSYYVVVSLGSCNITSNTYIVQNNDFNLAAVSPINSVIVQGETKTLTITTDALGMVITWYKDNIIIPGANGLSYTTTLPGTYKVIVNQTVTCVLTKEQIFTLVYPTTIVASIDLDSNYQSCVSTSGTISIVNFEAQSPLGNINLIGNTYNYSYQWYKNGLPLAGETNNQLSFNQHSQNGSYYLTITIPDYGVVTTNTVVVLTPFTANISITSSGLFCVQNPNVTLSSNYIDNGASYLWYNTNSTTPIATTQNLQVTQLGFYYLTVTKDGCTLTSNTLEVLPVDPNLVVVNQNSTVEINQGSEIDFIATGADTYNWYYNGILISNTNSLTVSEAGLYSLVATINGCQINKDFTVVVIENTMIDIPNSVTPNNDGYNDYWKIPAKYNADNVEIAIYDETGKPVLQTRSYQNNWPTDTTIISNKKLIYYYTISEDYVITRKGTITILK